MNFEFCDKIVNSHCTQQKVNKLNFSDYRRLTISSIRTVSRTQNLANFYVIWRQRVHRRKWCQP